LERKYPLAPSQQVFWALHEVYPDSSVGNEAIHFRLRGPLQPGAMRSAIHELAQRWDIWRSAIRVDHTSSAGAPIATVGTFDDFPIDELDLGELPAPQREGALRQLLDERLRTRFDLTRAPLMRVAMVRMGADDWVLQFLSHHVILDGISVLDVLPRVLSACYSSFLHGESPPAPAHTSYAEFAEGQRLAFASPERETLKYWKATLAGASGALDLASDRKRGKQRSWHAARVMLQVSAAQRERLHARAAEIGTSISDLLLAAFAIQLQRYSRQNDLLIGIANGNRRDPTLADQFGCLVLTMPVRCNLEGDPSLRELVHRLRVSKRAAFAHLDPGVDDVLGQVSGGGEARQSSGYRAVFNYMNFSLEDVRFEGLSVSAERPDPGWTSVDLSMDVNESRKTGGFECTLEYSSDLFEPETASRYLAHYGQLLAEIGGERGNVPHVSDLNLLGEDEQQAVLLNGNLTDRPYPKERCLHEIIRESAARNPDALAATNGERSLSYAELMRTASEITAALRAVGVSAGKRVVLILKDPLDALSAQLATLSAGAAYVPVDPALPRERLDFMLSASRPAAVVTDRATHKTLPVFPAPTLCVDDLAKPAPVSGRPVVPVTSEDPAYVIFTSGSTGRPKGVVVRHRNVVNQLYARLANYPQAPACTLVPHSFAFDAAVGAVYWTLATGGSLVLPNSDDRRDPAAIAELVVRYKVSHIDVVPSMYEQMLTAERSAQLASLKAVLIGGEACSAALAQRHFELLPGCALYNEYGPTETTVYSTMYELKAADVPDPVPIGKPIANTRCYVLDAHAHPAPLGIPGELYIAGAGVAVGYLNDPERTAERFVPDPFSTERDARMYRTGDVVRLRADGNIEFLGRVDRQIKIRGYRVELGEIEAALTRCPGVARAVAVPRHDPLGARVDAYVVPKRRKQELSLTDLRCALRNELPAYMIPNHLQVVAEIPLTPAGKVDIERLPLPGPGDAEDHARVANYVEPRTQTEQMLAQIWSELLGRPRIGMLDDFFDLGGHSLLAVRMLSLVEARLQVHVSLSSFFHKANISQLAKLLHQDPTIKEESLIVPIQTGDRPAFWLPHPVGGHVVFARRLAVHLDPEQPLMGIQAQGLDGQREPLRSIEQMAERYLELIRKAQPNGPYFLGGHSLGGLISFEIAQRLRAAGESVGMLALFDTPGPNYPRRTSLMVRIADLVEFRSNTFKAWLQRKSIDPVPHNEVEEYLRYDPLKGEQRGGALVDAIDRVTHFNEIAANNYRPRPYPGIVHVFRATQVPHWPGMRFDDPTCGWAPFAQHVETHTVDCTHQNMMDEPGVSELGEKLQDHLLACQERSQRAANSKQRARQARHASKAESDA
jgi:amino acid adenylation domain-containing protein